VPTKSSQHLERYSNLTKTVKAPGLDREPPISAALLKRVLPHASVQKANKVFENFSLSKFPEGARPSNYVHPYKNDASLSAAERTKHVQDIQKKKIEQHLHKLKTAEQNEADGKAVSGITLALPKDKIGEILPSYNRGKGKVTLDEVMNLIAEYTRGTEFRVKGDPTLNRLAFLQRVDKMRETLRLHARGQKKGEAR
jgi:hypothetical protein